MYVVTIEDGKKRKKVRAVFSFPRDRALVLYALEMIDYHFRQDQRTEGYPVCLLEKRAMSHMDLLKEYMGQLSGGAKWKPSSIVFNLKDETHKRIFTLVEADDKLLQLRKKKEFK